MFGLTTSKKHKASKEIALIQSNVKKIKEDSKKMKTALQTLNHNVGFINNVIQGVETADYTDYKDFIDTLDLEEEYKVELKKELENSREQALQTLKPIKVASEKIRGNMAVSMVKYRNMAVSLQAQKNVIESGAVQVETIDKAMEQGAMNSDAILELVQRAEEINNVTNKAISDFKTTADGLNDTFGGFGKEDADIFNLK